MGEFKECPKIFEEEEYYYRQIDPEYAGVGYEDFYAYTRHKFENRDEIYIEKLLPGKIITRNSASCGEVVNKCKDIFCGDATRVERAVLQYDISSISPFITPSHGWGRYFHLIDVVYGVYSYDTLHLDYEYRTDRHIYATVVVTSVAKKNIESRYYRDLPLDYGVFIKGGKERLSKGAHAVGRFVKRPLATYVNLSFVKTREDIKWCESEIKLRRNELIEKRVYEYLILFDDGASLAQSALKWAGFEISTKELLQEAYIHSGQSIINTQQINNKQKLVYPNDNVVEYIPLLSQHRDIVNSVNAVNKDAALALALVYSLPFISSTSMSTYIKDAVLCKVRGERRTSIPPVIRYGGTEIEIGLNALDSPLSTLLVAAIPATEYEYDVEIFCSELEELREWRWRNSRMC